jgi:hypothetical protein
VGLRSGRESVRRALPPPQPAATMRPRAGGSGSVARCFATEALAEGRPFIAMTEHDQAFMLARQGGRSARERSLALLESALASAADLGMRQLQQRADALRAELRA